VRSMAFESCLASCVASSEIMSDGDAAPGDAVIREKFRKVHWVPLESNPEMLTKFACSIGMPEKWEFTDVFSLDLLDMVPPGAVAVTLLYDSSRDPMRKFKAQQREELQKAGQKISPNLKYMRQYVGNACGTIATIHSLANNMEAMGIDAASPLGKFIAEAGSKPPEEFGAALVDATELHSASEASAQGGQTAAPEATAEIHNHFIAFVEKDGDIYELDGSKVFPINHGPLQGSLLETAAKVIQSKFMSLDPDSMNWNMMALVPGEA